MSIKLEPHSKFKKAIVRVSKRGMITYSYDALVDVCMEYYGLDREDGVEWVDYNILGLEPMGLRVSFDEQPAKPGRKKKG